jgi:hypothetical protein
MRLLLDARGAAGARVPASQRDFWRDILPRVLSRLPGGSVCLVREIGLSEPSISAEGVRVEYAEAPPLPDTATVQRLCADWRPDALLSTCGTHCDTSRTVAVIEPGLDAPALEARAGSIARAAHCVAVREEEVRLLMARASTLPPITVLYRAGEKAPLNPTIIANFIAKALRMPSV